MSSPSSSRQYQSSNNGLTPLATKYCSTIYSVSTAQTELSSPAISSRVLYHESFGRPVTSKSLPPHRLEEYEASPPREQQRRHYHTNSAETYTAQHRRKKSDSSLYFGIINMNTLNNHGMNQSTRISAAKKTRGIWIVMNLKQQEQSQRKKNSTLYPLLFGERYVDCID